MDSDRSNPKEPRLAEAAAALQSNQLDEAVRLFRLAATSSPAESANGLGTVAAIRGDLTTAAEQFERASRLDPENPLYRYQHGVALVAARRFEAAIGAFEACVRLDPAIGEAWFNLGSAQRDLGRFADAIESFQNAVDAPRSIEMARVALASTHRASGDLDAAVPAARAAVAHRGSWPEAWNELGLCLASKGELDEAVSAWKRCVEYAPQAVDPRFQLGVVAAMQGRLDDAERAYRDVIALQAAHIPARTNLAGLLIHRGDFAGAEGELAAAASHAQGPVPAVAVALGDLRMRQGRGADAERTYRDATRMAPHEARPQVGLISSLFMQQRHQEALAAIELATKSFPNDPVFLELKVNALALLARGTEAAELARSVIATHGSNPARQTLLGVALEACRDATAAAEAYREALRIDPNFEPAANGLDRLGSS